MLATVAQVGWDPLFLWGMPVDFCSNASTHTQNELKNHGTIKAGSRRVVCHLQAAAIVADRTSKNEKKKEEEGRWIILAGSSMLLSFLRTVLVYVRI